MSQCLFDGEGERGGEGRTALAPNSPFLCCLLSLCILQRDYCSPLLLVFLFISLSFMFSPLLNMIMHSKGTHGTGLRARARTRGPEQLKFTKRAKAAAGSVIPSRIDVETVFRWPFSKVQLSQSMLSFIFTYRDHEDKGNVYKEWKYK